MIEQRADLGSCFICDSISCTQTVDKGHSKTGSIFIFTQKIQINVYKMYSATSADF